MKGTKNNWSGFAVFVACCQKGRYLVPVAVLALGAVPVAVPVAVTVPVAVPVPVASQHPFSINMRRSMKVPVLREIVFSMGTNIREKVLYWHNLSQYPIRNGKNIDFLQVNSQKITEKVEKLFKLCPTECEINQNGRFLENSS